MDKPAPTVRSPVFNASATGHVEDDVGNSGNTTDKVLSPQERFHAAVGLIWRCRNVPAENDIEPTPPPPVAGALAAPSKTLPPPMVREGDMHVQFAGRSSRGAHRPVCGDALFFAPGPGAMKKRFETMVVAPERGFACTFAVIDGVSAKRVAAQAAGIVADELGVASGASPGDVVARSLTLASALDAANARLLAMNISGFAASVSAASVIGNTLVVAHVGHTSMLLGRDGRVESMTRKHTLAAEAARLDPHGPGEAEYSKQLRSELTRAVGAGDSLEIDFHVEHLRRGDWVLACSNGLLDPLPEGAILRVLAEEVEPARVCDRLVTMAIAHGGKDDASVGVLRVS